MSKKAPAPPPHVYAGTLTVPLYNKRHPHSFMNALVTPADNPLDWFIQPLPSTAAAEMFAADHNLQIVQEADLLASEEGEVE